MNNFSILGDRGWTGWTTYRKDNSHGSIYIYICVYRETGKSIARKLGCSHQSQLVTALVLRLPGLRLWQWAVALCSLSVSNAGCKFSMTSVQIPLPIQPVGCCRRNPPSPFQGAHTLSLSPASRTYGQLDVSKPLPTHLFLMALPACELPTLCGLGVTFKRLHTALDKPFERLRKKAISTGIIW